MNCLCCGKPLGEKASLHELQNVWHDKCVRSFFGTKLLPDINISDNALQKLASETINRGYTVPGVQKKLSLHLSCGSTREKPRLTLVNFPSGYILKPQTADYCALPEAEYLVMRMAQISGIKTVPFALLADKTGKNYSYITKRIDRSSEKNNQKFLILAMEDFCQLAGRLTADKYKGSYERCAKIIAKYSSQVGLDMSEFYLRIVFSFAVGNSDMHFKNFSLIEKIPQSGKYVLSEAYDMLPVNIVLPEDTEELALTLNGKKKRISREDFSEFATVCGIPQAAADKLLASIVKKHALYTELCRNSLIPDAMKTAFERLLSERIAVLAE